MYLTDFVGWMLLEYEIFLYLSLKAFYMFIFFALLWFHDKILIKVGERS